MGLKDASLANADILSFPQGSHSRAPPNRALAVGCAMPRDQGAAFMTACGASSDPFCEALPRSLRVGRADAGGFGQRYGLAHSHLRHICAHHFASNARMGGVSRIMVGVVGRASRVVVMMVEVVWLRHHKAGKSERKQR